jgi:hypothetical protein
MTYSVRRKPESSKEIQFSNRLAKLLTEDMGLNLEALGFHLVHNHPVIVSRRLEVVALTAGEEYDKMMTGYLGEDYTERWK